MQIPDTSSFGQHGEKEHGKKDNRIFNKHFGRLINHKCANNHYIANFSRQWECGCPGYQRVVKTKIQKLQTLLKDLKNKYHLPILEQEKAKYALEFGADSQIKKLYLLDLIAKQIPIFLPESNCLLTSHFGYRNHPMSHKKKKFHYAIDIAGPKGCDIYASADGVVCAQGSSWGYGQYLELDHGYGLKTRYAHLSKKNVKMGQVVMRGEKIGVQGKSGVATNHHLHFEVILHNNKETKRINGYDFVRNYF
ncbi:peptidoglycan DD-metalloendopeptidase family protein [Candidatus Sarmatiella mevalonica]|uniref:peptidoglycan DD-metalloendopeptidase family protein n=1 Tax=Candidatus Sarmatiella mevalonica TaxID=2770581 RepID=UPI001921EF00